MYRLIELRKLASRQLCRLPDQGWVNRRKCIAFRVFAAVIFERLFLWRLMFHIFGESMPID